MGVPAESMVTARKFLTCRLRLSSTIGSSVASSTPQFQLRLLFDPVPILLAIGIVVLLVVGDKIVKGAAVMTGDKVDALFGIFSRMTDVGASQDTTGEPADGSLVGPDKRTAVVSKLSVPFFPVAL